MKFCVEAAVSAAQGGTAVGPPPHITCIEIVTIAYSMTINEGL